MVCMFVLLLSPWVVRNYVRTGRVIPLTTKGTNLIYISSFPLTTEFYRPLTDNYDYANADKRYAPLEPGSSGIREAVRNYVSQPRAQLISTALKTIALLNKPAVLQRPLSPSVQIAIERVQRDVPRVPYVRYPGRGGAGVFETRSRIPLPAVFDRISVRSGALVVERASVPCAVLSIPHRPGVDLVP
jgi:hypothetical protein